MFFMVFLFCNILEGRSESYSEPGMHWNHASWQKSARPNPNLRECTSIVTYMHGAVFIYEGKTYLDTWCLAPVSRSSFIPAEFCVKHFAIRSTIRLLYMVHLLKIISTPKRVPANRSALNSPQSFSRLSLHFPLVRHFEMHFLEWKCVNFACDLTEICS